MTDKLTAISLREQQLDDAGHDENCAMREGHDCSCGVDTPAMPATLEVAQECRHRFEDARGNRVYLNCQNCGVRDPLEPDRETLTGPAAAALRAYKAAATAVRAAEEAHRRAAEVYRKALEEFTEAVMR